eukprot:CAMPEP_0170638476 /NCGR_PEP_ID=MMETSP0224-20130122/39060_1 /TAXON_ID=285029 /ORGANISM="Togula jolla, Strain CCCM 725" /LENGTH=30 /DNA_ID= /DNA_START= /DNA_END= /DNA_ORIENTATION=
MPGVSPGLESGGALSDSCAGPFAETAHQVG